MPLSDVLRLIQESGWQQYLEGIRKGKAERLLANPMFKMAQPAISRSTKPHRGTAHWKISNDNVRQMIRVGYWRGGPAPAPTQPSSQRTINFYKTSSPEKAMGRFYNELVLTLNNFLNGVKNQLEHSHNQEWLVSIGFFDHLTAEQIKGLMVKYLNPPLWQKIFSTADLAEQTFKDLHSDPNLGAELKQNLFSNPNWSDYDKVEDVLVDW